MSREALVKFYSNSNVHSNIYHYECFGWELIQLTENKLVFSRETQDEVYDELVKYERQYNDLYEQKAKLVDPKKPINSKPFNLLLCLVLFVLFIIPGIIYLIINKKNQDKYAEQLRMYDEDLLAYKDELADLNTQMANILAKSRALFYSKRSELLEQVEQVSENSEELNVTL